MIYLHRANQGRRSQPAVVDLTLEKKFALFLQLRHAMANLSGVVSVRRPITHVVFDMDGLLLGIPSIFNHSVPHSWLPTWFLDTHTYTIIVYWQCSYFVIVMLGDVSAETFCSFGNSIPLQILRSSIQKSRKRYLLDTTKPLIGPWRQRWWERKQ